MNDRSRKLLGFFPTPVVELKRLSKYFGGYKIFMKRDDQSGLAFGGNKTRKLEYLLGDAISKGCDTIITAGALQSNHCRQSAAAAAITGLDCHLVLGGERPEKCNGNLLLDHLLGATIHWAGKDRKGETIPDIFQQLESEGKFPYIIPYGGSNSIGASAFVEASGELEQQIKDVATIIFACSSGGTHAGLEVGKRFVKQRHDLIGIAVDKEESAPLEEQIAELAGLTSSYLGLDYKFKTKDIILNRNYLGEGYGILGDREKEAISLCAKLEGVLLDPTYTAKAMGGLIDMVTSGKIRKEDPILFWHTGGAPALFSCSGILLK